LFLQKPKGAKKPKKAPKGLTGDEKKVFDLIAKSDRTIYQHEIVKQTEFSKVKITRVLDKLESKDLIERRRRGMSNIVVLK